MLLGAPTDVRTALIRATSNIICYLLFGKRFEYTDKQHQSIVDVFRKLLKLQGGRGAMVGHGTYSVPTGCISRSGFNLLYSMADFKGLCNPLCSL